MQGPSPALVRQEAEGGLLLVEALVRCSAGALQLPSQAKGVWAAACVDHTIFSGVQGADCSQLADRCCRYLACIRR